MKWWRVALLGAINGLFSSAVYLMLYRVDEYYTEIQEKVWKARAEAEGLCTYTIGIDPFWWVSTSCWHVILFIGSSLLVHRYLAKHIKSVFLLWQSISLLVIVGWGLVALAVTILDGFIVRGEFPAGNILEGILSTSNQYYAFKFVALMIGINVIFGTLMQIVVEHYRSPEAE